MPKPPLFTRDPEEWAERVCDLLERRFESSDATPSDVRGIHPSIVRRLFQRRGRRMSFHAVACIAHACGLSLDDLARLRRRK